MLAVRVGLLVMGLLALVVYRFDPVGAKGVLLGGLGGIIGFWYLAMRLEKLASLPPSKVKFAALRWTALRLVLYGAVLYKAYTLDRETLHGLIGGVAGIFVIRFVQIVLGLTGADLGSGRRTESESGKAGRAGGEKDSSDFVKKA